MRLMWFGLSLAVLSTAAPSRAGAQAALTGYVRDEESLRGLQGAELSVDGSDKKARTDKEGKYSLRDLAAGNVRVHVRFVGFTPLDTILELGAGKPTESVFFLSKHAVQLDTVTSKSGRTASAGFESFELRRAQGFGRFIDSTYLRQHENQQFSTILIDIGKVDVIRPGTCHGSYTVMCNVRVAITKKPIADIVCVAQVVLDGHVIARGMEIDNRDAPPGASAAMLKMFEARKESGWRVAFDLNSINPASLSGVEIYRNAAEAPALFGSDDGGCGIVVLWTRRG